MLLLWTQIRRRRRRLCHTGALFRRGKVSGAGGDELFDSALGRAQGSLGASQLRRKARVLFAKTHKFYAA